MSVSRTARPARSRAIRRSSRCVLWGLTLVIVAHLALTFAVSFWTPEVRDPDQTLKLQKLQQCLRDATPGRPLFLMMGSSRVAMGYRPELLERADGPLYYNYGLCYSGPILDLITLHRLLDAGIHPKTILLEVWPPHLATDMADDPEAVGVDVRRLTWRDLELLAGISSQRRKLYERWFASRLESWSSYRFTLAHLFGTTWLDDSRDTVVRWSGIQERGWLDQAPYRIHPAQSVYQNYLHHTRLSLARVLHNPKMSRDARLALTEFLDVCRHEDIQVGLIWLPESPDFRRSYRPEGLVDSSADLRAIARQANVPLIDANDWIPEDGFIDGYHLSHAGADLFTRMLNREVLTPLVARSAGSLPFGAGLLTRKPVSDQNATSQGKLPFSLSIR